MASWVKLQKGLVVAGLFMRAILDLLPRLDDDTVVRNCNRFQSTNTSPHFCDQNIGKSGQICRKWEKGSILALTDTGKVVIENCDKGSDILTDAEDLGSMFGEQREG